MIRAGIRGLRLEAWELTDLKSRRQELPARHPRRSSSAILCFDPSFWQDEAFSDLLTTCPGTSHPATERVVVPRSGQSYPQSDRAPRLIGGCDGEERANPFRIG